MSEFSRFYLKSAKFSQTDVMCMRGSTVCCFKLIPTTIKNESFSTSDLFRCQHVSVPPLGLHQDKISQIIKIYESWYRRQRHQRVGRSAGVPQDARHQAQLAQRGHHVEQHGGQHEADASESVKIEEFFFLQNFVPKSFLVTSIPCR